ncbi:MAG: LysM domain-containing protein [Anaerolineae bacterium]
MRSRSWLILITLGLGLLAAGLTQPIGWVAARSAQLPDRATAQPTPTPLIGAPLTYTVAAGDTFNAIAKRFNLTPAQLSALNQITNTNLLKAGQILIVGVATFTPTLAPTSSPTPISTATTTSTPAATVTAEATAIPTEPATVSPQPTATVEIVPSATRPPTTTTPTSAGIPVDVYLVGGLMVLALIGLVIGFRTQHR